MDRFDAMRLFTRVVDRRSFTRAAEDAGMPRSTVTEAVAQLERRLGTRLLQRTTRHVAPTIEGEAYYQRCTALIADLEEAEAAVGDATPRGLLRIDVHGTLARHFLLPSLPRFLSAYPDLQLHIGEGDRLVDLVREGVDCVLRSGEPRNSDMIARRITLLEEVTCASPDYLRRRGNPASPDDLGGHQMVGFMSTGAGQVLPLLFLTNGTKKTVSLPTTVSVAAAETYVAAARLGLGLIQVPRYHAEPWLTAGALLTVLDDFPPPPRPVSVLYPRTRRLSPRVRVFVDWLVQEFGIKEYR